MISETAGTLNLDLAAEDEMSIGEGIAEIFLDDAKCRRVFCEFHFNSGVASEVDEVDSLKEKLKLN